MQKTLLSLTDFTIEQVAAAVGYNNAGRFASMFKKSTGVYPAEYRKWHRKNKMSTKGNSGAHMIIEISTLENHFLHLRFQRVHQPHPTHGVTGFQFLGDAASIMRGSMASIRSVAA